MVADEWELTESFSALTHLRPFLPESGHVRVLHVGDGALQGGSS